MTKIGRRKFFGFMAASPLAAKAAAEQAQMNIGNLEVEGQRIGIGSRLLPSGMETNPVTPRKVRSFAEMVSALGGKIPDWKLEDIQNDARHVHTISPNIASLKSVSLSGKVEMQKRENIKRGKRDFWESLKREERHEIRNKFREKLGFWI